MLTCVIAAVSVLQHLPIPAAAVEGGIVYTEYDKFKLGNDYFTPVGANLYGRTNKIAFKAC